MTKEEKTAVIEELKEKFENSSFFYITDASSLTVEKINKLRRICFEKNVEIRVVKNTLVRKALESAEEERGYAQLYSALNGPSTILFGPAANLPAKLLEDFRKTNDRPILKAAYIDTDVYIGDEQLGVLAKLKSKEDLLGDIVALLQSPAKNVVSGLKSGGAKLAGILKTLEERGA